MTLQLVLHLESSCFSWQLWRRHITACDWNFDSTDLLEDVENVISKRDSCILKATWPVSKRVWKQGVDHVANGKLPCIRRGTVDWDHQVIDACHWPKYRTCPKIPPLPRPNDESEK